MSSLRPSSEVSQITGASAARHHRDQQLGIDLAGAEVGVPVGARALRRRASRCSAPGRCGR